MPMMAIPDVEISAVQLVIRSKKVKVKADIALNGTPSQSYGTSLAIWDHTVLPATGHK